MRETGPNDARCIVWATGMYSFFRHIFYILTTNFCLFRLNILLKTGLGEKRAQMTRLASFGPKVCFFFSFFRVFYNLIHLFRAFFSYRTPPAHSSTTTTAPSLETRVGGVFFLSSAPPSLETWDGGVTLGFFCCTLTPTPANPYPPSGVGVFCG